MVDILNMDIKIKNDAKSTIDLITNNLKINWGRNYSAEKNINQIARTQYGFQFNDGTINVTVFFIERNGNLTTTNVVPDPSYASQIPIEMCNDMIILFAKSNLNGIVKYSIYN